MTREEKPLFTIPRKDFKMEFFRAGGKGGQKVNKTSSACRITHVPSRAVGESREERSQVQNRKLAFLRLSKTEKFKRWVKIEAAARMQGYRDAKAKIEDMMKPKNIRIEVEIEDGWKEISS